MTRNLYIFIFCIVFVIGVYYILQGDFLEGTGLLLALLGMYDTVDRVLRDTDKQTDDDYWLNGK